MASVIDSERASRVSSPVGTPPRNGLLERGAAGPGAPDVRGAAGASIVEICAPIGEMLQIRNTTTSTVGSTALTSNPFLAWWSTRQGRGWACVAWSEAGQPPRWLPILHPTTPPPADPDA